MFRKNALQRIEERATLLEEESAKAAELDFIAKNKWEPLFKTASKSKKTTDKNLTEASLNQYQTDITHLEKLLVSKVKLGVNYPDKERDKHVKDLDTLKKDLKTKQLKLQPKEPTIKKAKKTQTQDILAWDAEPDLDQTLLTSSRHAEEFKQIEMNQRRVTHAIQTGNKFELTQRKAEELTATAINTTNKVVIKPAIQELQQADEMLERMKKYENAFAKPVPAQPENPESPSGDAEKSTNCCCSCWVNFFSSKKNKEPKQAGYQKLPSAQI